MYDPADALLTIVAVLHGARNVEAFESADGTRRYPRCVAGEGRYPPEDCGGVHGYEEFLQVIADPDHEEHDSTLTWAGGEFDRTPSIRPR